MSKRLLPIVALPVLLSACTMAGGLVEPGFQVLGSYQTLAGPTGLLRRRVADGSLSLDLTGTNAHVALTTMSQAGILNVWRSGQDTIAAIRGGSPSCPVSFVLVASNATVVRWSDPFGDCASEFVPVARPGGMAMVQAGTANPVTVAYSAGRFTMAQPALAPGRQARPGPPPRSPRGYPAPPAMQPMPERSAPYAPALPPVQQRPEPHTDAPLRRVGPEVVPGETSAPGRPRSQSPTFDPS